MGKRRKRIEDEATEVIAALRGDGDQGGSWEGSVTARRAHRDGQIARTLDYLRFAACVSIPEGERLTEVRSRASVILRAEPGAPLAAAITGEPG
jgi:hypothetical protein